MKRPWQHITTTNQVRILSGLVVLLHFSPGAAQTNLPPLGLPDFEIRLWQAEVQVRGALGYKDNVTLSSIDPLGSLFWSTELEGLTFRLPSGGWRFSAFLDAVDVRYFDAPSVDDEQELVAVAELTRQLGADWESTLGFSYLFQDQVFDLSSTYTTPTAIGQVVSHTLAPRWRLRKEWDPFWVEGEISATRQILEAPYDSYWEVGPRVTIGRKLQERSEIELAYQWSWLDYDSRTQVDSTGASITNTSLAFQTHLVELAWTQTWDDKNRWRTTTRGGVELNADNGSGFYDYHHYRFIQELRFRDPHWEARLRARVSYYDYPSQPVSATDPSLRHRTLVGLTLHAERQLVKHLRLFASYTLTESISNLAYDEYEANVLAGGFALNF